MQPVTWQPQAVSPAGTPTTEGAAEALHKLVRPEELYPYNAPWEELNTSWDGSQALYECSPPRMLFAGARCDFVCMAHDLNDARFVFDSFMFSILRDPGQQLTPGDPYIYSEIAIPDYPASCFMARHAFRYYNASVAWREHMHAWLEDSWFHAQSEAYLEQNAAVTDLPAAYIFWPWLHQQPDYACARWNFQTVLYLDALNCEPMTRLERQVTLHRARNQQQSAQMFSYFDRNLFHFVPLGYETYQLIDEPAYRGGDQLYQPQVDRYLEEDGARPITALTTNINPSAGDLPENKAIARYAKEGEVHDTVGSSRYQPQQYVWQAPATSNRPLYFEEPNLERYGHQHAVVQPIISGMVFFTNFAILPYKMVAQPYDECVYTLGHYRPGSPAPVRIHYPYPLQKLGVFRTPAPEMPDISDPDYYERGYAVE